MNKLYAKQELLAKYSQLSEMVVNRQGFDLANFIFNQLQNFTDNKKYICKRATLNKIMQYAKFNDNYIIFFKNKSYYMLISST